MIIQEDGQMTMFMEKPFGCQSLLSVGPNDHIYYAWSENPVIEITTKTGEWVDSVKVGLPNREITPDLIEEHLENYDEDVVEFIRDGFPETKTRFP